MSAIEPGIHPAAEIFPPLTPRELEELARDIRQHGLREPITMHPDGRILDGRNRYEACKRAEVLPHFRRWDGRGGSEIDFVMSTNLRRRHLTPSQLAMVGARIKLYLEPEARTRKGDRTDLSADLRSSGAPQPEAPEPAYGKSAEHAAEQLAVSARSVETAAQVLRDGAPELVSAVERGEASVHAAAAVSTLPPAEQVEIVARGEEEILRVAKELRAKKRAENYASSDSPDWYSPQHIVSLASIVMGGIDLDPASSTEANVIVKAKHIFTIENDGLGRPWFGNVWLNPPYGRDEDYEPNQGKWSAKLIGEYVAGRVRAAHLLVNAMVGAEWFRQLWRYPICFHEGRLSFWRPGEQIDKTQPSMRDSAIIYLGPDPQGFAELFSKFGQIVMPSETGPIALVQAGEAQPKE